MGLIVEGIVLIIPFMIIRTFSGGTHSKSPGRCFVISAGILIILLVMSKMISNSLLLSIIMLGACISLIVCSPIENENKQLRATLKQEELENVEKEMEHSENRYKIGGNSPSNFVKQDIIQICQR